MDKKVAFEMAVARARLRLVASGRKVTWGEVMQEAERDFAEDEKRLSAEDESTSRSARSG